jgi:hypothetical protein
MLTRQQVLYGLEQVELRSTSIFDECPLKSSGGRQQRQKRQDNDDIDDEDDGGGCSGFAALFRTPDGTCNNFKHPNWGSSFMPFLRFLPPDYRYKINVYVVNELNKYPNWGSSFMPFLRFLPPDYRSDLTH